MCLFAARLLKGILVVGQKIVIFALHLVNSPDNRSSLFSDLIVWYNFRC